MRGEDLKKSLERMGHRTVEPDGSGFVIGGQQKPATPKDEAPLPIFNKEGLEEQRAWQKHRDRQRMPLVKPPRKEAST